ncbi:MAG TPA: acyl carrier protein [Ktedonobacteraceae bacterium]|nr:acyl carrier protein [Ktedonobacteraceae bacterium]
MQRSEVLEQVKSYIARQVLDGKDIGLHETTPLLEWGLINSLEIVRLLSFLQEQFYIEVPSEKIVADYFINLASIADLVVELDGVL